MDIYHIWCNLKPGVTDSDFCNQFERYMEHLRDQGAIRRHRLTRRKLGLGPGSLGEFHIMIEVEDLAQLDSAFQHVASRAGKVEGLHHSVNALVQDAIFALYRDFPDPVRKRGEEQF